MSIIPSSRRLNPNYQRVYAPISGESLTQQEFKDQCDINHQIALFTKAGRPLPAYGSEPVEQVQDLNATYIDAVNAVREVEDAFSQVPAKVRAQFNNSPLIMAQFLADPANAQKAYELGLINNPPPKAVPPAEPSVAPAGGEAVPTGTQGAGA